MPTTANDREVRALLAATTDGGDPEVASLVSRWGVTETWRAVLDGAVGKPAAARAARARWEAIEEATARAGARFVVPGDEEWPTGLDDLDHVEPVRRRGGVPLGIWVRGPGQLAAACDHSVAIVGSRACTAYGSGVASDLAVELAGRGVTVVSGGAFGIDVAAHRGALAAGGPGVAVLANGVDVAYPQGNAAVLDRLGREHLLVSELPPGSHPTRVRFLSRNRLIAAMTRGTVVVEAALRSGARNTAGWAVALGRVLMAVPGPVHSAASAAPHLMIRSGQAVLVGDAGEVLELVSGMGEATLAAASGLSRATDRLSEAELAVYEALSARRQTGVGEVALLAGVSVPCCLAALSTLERLGLAVGDAGGWLALVGGMRVAGAGPEGDA